MLVLWNTMNLARPSDPPASNILCARLYNNANIISWPVWWKFACCSRGIQQSKYAFKSPESYCRATYLVTACNLCLIVRQNVIGDFPIYTSVSRSLASTVHASTVKHYELGTSQWPSSKQYTLCKIIQQCKYNFMACVMKIRVLFPGYTTKQIRFQVARVVLQGYLSGNSL